MANLRDRALELLLSANQRARVIADYQQMRSLLGDTGVCDRAAREILKSLRA